MVAIAVPTPEQEAARDLCRARSALVRDRQRLDKLVHAWLGGLIFEDPALRPRSHTTAVWCGPEMRC